VTYHIVASEIALRATHGPFDYILLLSISLRALYYVILHYITFSDLEQPGDDLGGGRGVLQRLDRQHKPLERHAPHLAAVAIPCSSQRRPTTPRRVDGW